MKVPTVRRGFVFLADVFKRTREGLALSWPLFPFSLDVLRNFGNINAKELSRPELEGCHCLYLQTVLCTYFDRGWASRKARQVTRARDFSVGTTPRDCPYSRVFLPLVEDAHEPVSGSRSLTVFLVSFRLSPVPASLPVFCGHQPVFQHPLSLKLFSL